MSHSMAAIIIVDPFMTAPRIDVNTEKYIVLGSGLLEPLATRNSKADEIIIPPSKMGDLSGIKSEAIPISAFPKYDPALK